MGVAGATTWALPGTVVARKKSDFGISFLCERAPRRRPRRQPRPMMPATATRFKPKSKVESLPGDVGREVPDRRMCQESRPCRGVYAGSLGSRRVNTTHQMHSCVPEGAHWAIEVPRAGREFSNEHATGPFLQEGNSCSRYHYGRSVRGEG